MNINKELEIIVNFVSSQHPKIYKEAVRHINETRNQILRIPEENTTSYMDVATHRDNNGSRSTGLKYINS